MVDLLGWLGSFFFAICAIPQAHKCYKQKHAHGISYMLILFMFLAEVCLIAFLTLNDNMTIEAKAPLLVNYVLGYYRLFPTEEK